MEKRVAVLEETQENTLDKMLAKPQEPQDLTTMVKAEVERAILQQAPPGKGVILGVTQAEWAEYKVEMAAHLTKILREDRQRIAEYWEQTLETPGRWPSWVDLDKVAEDMRRKIMQQVDARFEATDQWGTNVEQHLKYVEGCLHTFQLKFATPQPEVASPTISSQDTESTRSVVPEEKSVDRSKVLQEKSRLLQERLAEGHTTLLEKSDTFGWFRDCSPCVTHHT